MTLCLNDSVRLVHSTQSWYGKAWTYQKKVSETLVQTRSAVADKGGYIMNNLLKRMLGAARLNADTYEQVEADRTSLTGAVFTAVIASVAAAIGTGARDVVGVVSATSVLLMTWIVWVVLT